MDISENPTVNECPQTEDTCCICMDTVNTTDNGHLTSKCCKHLIHINCFVSYTLKNAHCANKCPMCRYDMNTGQPFQASEYDTGIDSYDYYSEDEDIYEYDSYSESENDDESQIVTIPGTQTLPTQQAKSRTATEINAYCASAYVSPITTQPVNLTNISNSSQTGMVYYTSEKYDCMATYNPYIQAMDVYYQTKPPLTPVDRHRKIVCGDIPRCVSIQLTPTGMLYVLVVYPDDGECDKMLIYFPDRETVIMSAFFDKSALAGHNLDNLQITGFSALKYNNRFIYINDCESSGGSLLAEVIEFQKLKQVFNS